MTIADDVYRTLTAMARVQGDREPVRTPDFDRAVERIARGDVSKKDDKNLVFLVEEARRRAQ